MAQDHESIGLMEPMRVGEGSRFRGELGDLALELAQKSAALRHAIPQPLAASLATLVRAVTLKFNHLPKSLGGLA